MTTRFAPTVLFDAVGDRFFALFAGQSVELAGVDLKAGSDVSGVKLSSVPTGRRDDDANW